MEFKNMGTYDGGVISSSPATAMASQRFRTMDAAAIANNGAFLQSELEKKDNVIAAGLPVLLTAVIFRSASAEAGQSLYRP